MGPESRLEARCCALAIRQGCYPIKLGGFVVGLPDRVFLLPGGGVWLVEFKSPTGQVSLRQKYEFIELHRLGHSVEIVRSAGMFARALARKLGLPAPVRPVQLRLAMP